MTRNFCTYSNLLAPVTYDERGVEFGEHGAHHPHVGEKYLSVMVEPRARSSSVQVVPNGTAASEQRRERERVQRRGKKFTRSGITTISLTMGQLTEDAANTSIFGEQV